MSSLGKWSIIFSLLAITMFAAEYYKKVQQVVFDQGENSDLILKELPEFLTIELNSKKTIDKNSLLAMKAKGYVVHFWGTWCPPCEAEFPELVELMNKLEHRNVKFLLVALNDEEKKVRKFIKRFKKISPNAIFVLDKSGKSQIQFGSVRVPDTFLFKGDGKAFKKLIGPQDWGNFYYLDLIRQML